jgi:hypothetical protein
VNALLAWPAAQPSVHDLAREPLADVNEYQLQLALNQLQNEPVVWLGELFSVQVQGNSWLQENITRFDKLIKFCPEC